MRIQFKFAILMMAGLVSISFALTLALIAQTLSPGEVRLSSRPYVPQAPIRVQTRLVQLEVVVRDNRGRPVPGLTKDDFTLYDAHNIREITSFSISSSNPPVQATPKPAATQSDAPVPQPASTPPPTPPQPVSNGRSIALLFDDINTPPGDMIRAKVAATRFVKEASASGDRIGLFTTSAGPILKFTTDTSAILAAITHVEPHLRMSPNGLSVCPRITPYEAYQIVNNNPTALSAKIQEAACCTSSQYLYLCKSDLGGSGGILFPNQSVATELTIAVNAQAEQTWGQARIAAQSTLDSIKAALEQLSKTPGQHMLLLSSSGFLSGTLDQQLDAIISEAVSAGVVINSLDAKGLYAEAPGTPLNESVDVVELPMGTTILQIQSLGDRLDSEDSAMARFAESTGGLLFRNNNDLELGFYQLGVMPSVTYLLGFPPDEDGVYHKIKVELKNAGRRIVLVRPGYFAPAKGSTDQPIPAADTIDSEMRGSAEKTDLPAVTTEKFGTAASGSPQLTLQTHVDIQKLTFPPQQDRQVQKLTFVAALYDSQGNFVTGKEAEMTLALKQESFDRLSKSGINGVMQLEAPPGAYRLRMVVQEAVHGAMTATSKDLRIP
jgi:VWFA-related protein